MILYICVCNGSGVATSDTDNSVTKLEFPDGASYYLSSGFTAYTSNANDTFIFTENTNETILEEYLSNTKKNVYFCVKSGNDILFSDNLGICDSTDALDSNVSTNTEINDAADTYTTTLTVVDLANATEEMGAFVI